MIGLGMRRRTKPLLAVWRPATVLLVACTPGGAEVKHPPDARSMACEIVGELRPGSERYQCRVESFRETSTEYIVRVTEAAPAGISTPVFPRSEVRLQKGGWSVTVTREAEP